MEQMSTSTDRSKPNYSEESLFQCYFTHHKSTWTDPYLDAFRYFLQRNVGLYLDWARSRFLSDRLQFITSRSVILLYTVGYRQLIRFQVGARACLLQVRSRGRSLRLAQPQIRWLQVRLSPG